MRLKEIRWQNILPIRRFLFYCLRHSHGFEKGDGPYMELLHGYWLRLLKIQPLWEENQSGGCIHHMKCHLGYIPGQVSGCPKVLVDLRTQIAIFVEAISTDKAKQKELAEEIRGTFEILGQHTG